MSEHVNELSNILVRIISNLSMTAINNAGSMCLLVSFLWSWILQPFSVFFIIEENFWILRIHVDFSLNIKDDHIYEIGHQAVHSAEIIRVPRFQELVKLLVCYIDTLLFLVSSPSLAQL